MTKKSENPKAYTAPHDVYTRGEYTKAGEVFVTAEPKGKEWDEVTIAEKAAIDASHNDQGEDVPLEGLSVEALKAVAVTKKVNITGLKTAEDIITAIKAAVEPRL